jgi:hypothetical protein
MNPESRFSSALKVVAILALVDIGILAALFFVLEVWVFGVFALSGVPVIFGICQPIGIPPFGSPICLHSFDASYFAFQVQPWLNIAHSSFYTMEFVFLAWADISRVRRMGR